MYINNKLSLQVNRLLLLGPLHLVTKKICLKDIILSYEVFELLHKQKYTGKSVQPSKVKNDQQIIILPNVIEKLYIYI